MSSQSRMSSIFEHPLTIVAAGLIVGFILGRVTAPISTTKHLQATSEQQSKKSEGKKNAKAASRSEDEDEESDEEGVYGDFAGNDEECKLILVVRTDLGMTRGKIAAQCSHATLACYKALQKQEETSKKPFAMLRRWEYWGQAKVTVQVKSEDELLMLQAQAMSLGLCAKIIHDAGRTQIASGSATVLGVGPGPKSVVDQVTGHLKLL